MGEAKQTRPLNIPYLTLNEGGLRVQLRVGAGAPTDGTSGTGAGDADTGSLYLDQTNGGIYQNTGTRTTPAWTPTQGGIDGAVEVWNDTGVTIEDGDLVYISGWLESQAKPTIALADADVQGAPAEYIIRTDIGDGAAGLAFRSYRETGGIDLAGKAVGDPLFLSTTAGDATLTDPTDADPNALSQIVGFVAIVATDVTEYRLDGPLVQIGENEIQDEAITNAKVAAAAGIVRSKLGQDDLTVHATELSQWRQSDQAAMGITGTAGDHFFDVTTNVHRLVGNTPSSSTVTDISLFQFVIPENYVDGQTISFRAAAKVDTAADTNTIQAKIYEASATDGAVGGDLATGGAIAVTNTAAFKTWTIDTAGLVAGDRLNVELTTINNDADGTDGIVSIYSLDFLIDVKG